MGLPIGLIRRTQSPFPVFQDFPKKFLMSHGLLLR